MKRILLVFGLAASLAACAKQTPPPENPSNANQAQPEAGNPPAGGSGCQPASGGNPCEKKGGW